jgi:predicted nucleic acid-binding protein
MVKVLFDTNILIDYLNGIQLAKEELARYEYKAISIITSMEVLLGATPENDGAIRAWLDTFDIISLDASIANSAIKIRRQYKIKLPDAIILASAHVHALLLVSRNTKDFSADEPGIRIPYKL